MGAGEREGTFLMQITQYSAGSKESFLAFQVLGLLFFEGLTPIISALKWPHAQCIALHNLEGFIYIFALEINWL